MNKVILVGRLTRDPELRKLASGKTITSFSVATTDDAKQVEYHSVVTWDKLAEICDQFLAKGIMVGIDGRLVTRQWEDDNKYRHWRTEIVAERVEMLSGRRRGSFGDEAQPDSS